MKDPPPADKYVGIYTRVSTDIQVDRDSLPMQRKDLLAYAELILGVPPERCIVYEDAGYSGKDLKRPRFQEMMAAARRGELSHILVWKIDRISRNLLDFIQLYEELKKLKVTFISKNEAFDTSSAMGVAMLQILLVFAQLERAMTAERVRATMISRASEGIWNGGNIPTGYTYDKESGVFSIDEDEAKIVRMIFDLYLKEKSAVVVAHALNAMGIKSKHGKKWSATAVWGIIRNVWYLGTYRYNRYKGTFGRVENKDEEWVLIENHHPAIIDEETFGLVRATIEGNTRYKDGAKYAHHPWSDHIFRGIVRCDYCGTRMTGTANKRYSDGSRAVVYRCDMMYGGMCENASLFESIIGNLVFNFLRNLHYAKEHYSKIRFGNDLADTLIQGTAFRSIEQLSAASVNDIRDVLQKFGGDRSYKQSGIAGHQLRRADPEAGELKAERRKLQKAYERLNEAYLYRVKAMPEAEYISKREDILAKINAVDEKLGLLRGSADDLTTTEDVYKALNELCSIPQIKKGNHVDYKLVTMECNHTQVRDLLEQIVDCVRIRDGYVASIILRDGTKVAFEYDRHFLEKAEHRKSIKHYKTASITEQQ